MNTIHHLEKEAVHKRIHRIDIKNYSAECGNVRADLKHGARESYSNQVLE